MQAIMCLYFLALMAFLTDVGPACMLKSVTYTRQTVKSPARNPRKAIIATVEHIVETQRCGKGFSYAV